MEGDCIAGDRRMKQLLGWLLIFLGIFLLASCAFPGKIVRDTSEYKIYCEKGVHYVIRGGRNKGHFPCDCEK